MWYWRLRKASFSRIRYRMCLWYRFWNVFGKNGNKALAFASGWKLKKGAMASSAAPDDNNLVVMGANAEDMSIAANYLIEQGGGQVVVCDGEIKEFLPLPVGGNCDGS